MNPPKIKIHDWITVGKPSGHFWGVDAIVLGIISETELRIGYHQNKLKEIGEVVVWNEDSWEFKDRNNGGLYLRGHDAYLVRQGPPRYDSLADRLSNL